MKPKIAKYKARGFWTLTHGTFTGREHSYDFPTWDKALDALRTLYRMRVIW